MPTTLGPNTNAPPGILHNRCLLCVGEDREALLEALSRAGKPQAIRQCRYRSYEFWRFTDFSTILSGIGTGCLEPLLFEILRPAVIQKIVLIGTAGSMAGADVEAGQAYLIDPAWPAGTGIDSEVQQLPLHPRWKLPRGLKRASGVSTDFYYGFSPAILSGNYPTKGHRLRGLFEEHQRRGTELVDMEVAQFYYFCMCFGRSTLEYAAVKAPANAVGSQGQQLSYTLRAIGSCLTTAFRLLLGGA
jgi:hypothetical protein